jgi:hypothetical protein
MTIVHELTLFDAIADSLEKTNNGSTREVTA